MFARPRLRGPWVSPSLGSEPRGGSSRGAADLDEVVAERRAVGEIAERVTREAVRAGAVRLRRPSPERQRHGPTRNRIAHCCGGDDTAEIVVHLDAITGRD